MTERWRLVNTDKAEELYDIVNDPAQRNNIASQRPGFIKDLRTAYQSFWKRVSPGLKPVAIDLGDPSENPAVLCSQDWRPETGNPPWNFSSIKKIPKVTHPWLVNVLKAGKYRFTLRQWPKEADKTIAGVKARIKIAGLEGEAVIKEGSDLHPFFGLYDSHVSVTFIPEPPPQTQIRLLKTAHPGPLSCGALLLWFAWHVMGGGWDMCERMCVTASAVTALACPPGQ